MVEVWRYRCPKATTGTAGNDWFSAKLDIACF